MSESKAMKQVHFNEKVKIVEIQRIRDMLDGSDDEISIYGRSLDFERSSKYFSSNKSRPITQLSKIPATLFDSSPSNTNKYLASSIDHRWREAQTFGSQETAIAPFAPVHNPCIDQILQNSLAILAESPPSTTIGELASRRNHSWGDDGKSMAARKRQKRDAPPTIPLRRWC